MKSKTTRVSFVCLLVALGVLHGCGGKNTETVTDTEKVTDSESGTDTDTGGGDNSSTSPLTFESQVIVAAASPGLCIGSTDNNEAVVLTDCQNSETSQLWSYNESTKTLTHTQSQKCVANVQSKLVLQACDDSSAQAWSYEDNIFSQNGESFDVNMSQLSIIVYPTHGGANQQWLVPSLAAAEIDENYVSEFPFPDWDENAYKMEQIMDIINRRTAIDEALPFPRDVSSYPGEVDESRPRISKEVTFNRYFHEDQTLDTLKRQHWISTGTYAPAGEIIEINVSAEKDLEDLYAIINVHTDVLALTSPNVTNSKQVKRYTSVSTKVRLSRGINKLRSQYGGQVIIASERSEDLDVTVSIANVVETVHFKLGRDKFTNWLAIRENSAPWGVLEGKHVYLDMSKEELQKVEDPEALLNTFDQTIELVRDLAGFEKTATGVHKMPTLKERFVSDVQITAGFAHAGYPIMAGPGWNLFSVDTARNNGWGNWHETGHNYQQFCLWSRPFGTESSVNLFSLYVQDTLGQQSRIQQENRYAIAINKLNDDFSFTDDADVWDKLVFLMQIKHALPDIGWDMYRQLNRRFRELDSQQQQSVCATSQASFDATFEFLSEITGYDLTQHFKTWGVGVSEASYQKVADMGLPQPPVDISALNPGS
ncbi:M60 family metallopeptidase [Lacimicrobium alkaliphilum]|uniref:M60 family metallopeptidase n=1 Tax=Lacimicrobium alkaliphilum TaxID=1526571 RepID=UPI0009ECA503|nr:M60 family metallopeptidase [Lacimicrobium alkaliphilum]